MEQMKTPPPSEEVDPHQPKSWPRLYAVVLGELVVLIVLFYLFTKVFE